MKLKKYNEFIEKINETGIRDIRNTVKGYSECEIYFHQDLDGVVSAVAMKEYLRRYGIKTVDAHIIQYGGLEFAIKTTQEGRLPVLVDFAHGKPLFKIHTDHHDSQAGAEHTGSTSFKHTRSNAETISGEISPTDLFTHTDIELIRTVDSADFFRKGVTPDMVTKSIFELEKGKSPQENRFVMGFTVNRLLLAYKNKKITGRSLDGKNTYKDKNFLECLVLDSTPSLHSMFNNIRHYINNFTTSNWLRSERRYDEKGKLATPETLAKNLFKYQETMKGYTNLNVDEEYKIGIQYGGAGKAIDPDTGEEKSASMFEPGSYDRYTVFRNNPEINFYSIVWPMGLIQVSCNPFKEKKLKAIHLGEIAKEVMAKYESILKRIMISVDNVKRENEMELESKAKKEGDRNARIGFKYTDLEAFFDGKVMYQQRDGKVNKYNLKGTSGFNDLIKKLMNMLYKDLSPKQRKVLSNLKISAWDLIMGNSGGHPSITNLQGWNFLKYTPKQLKDSYLKRAFGESEYTDIMKVVQSQIIQKLREEIDEHEKSGDIQVDLKGDEYGMGGQSLN